MTKIQLKSKIKTLLLLFLLMFFSCDIIDSSLSKEEIARGLKSALEVGTDYALRTLGKKDGFLLDQAVKIGLPEDAAKFLKQAAANPIVGNLIKELENELILTINRAAETAVSDVVPIFLDAITSMTIQDANTILFSSNNYAATHYLKDKTYSALSEICISVIQGALNKKILGIGSAQNIWEKLMTVHNTAAMYIPNCEPIETELSHYTTEKTLDAMFLKIGDEEQKIRTDASARINDILRKVFGQLD